MNTTDDTNISEDQESYKDSPDNDSGKTQTQIDKEEHDTLVKAEVSAPISESQVEPGREVVDGNGLRQTLDVEPTRPDIIVDKDASTQHAREVQERQLTKLNTNSKTGEHDTGTE